MFITEFMQYWRCQIKTWRQFDDNCQTLSIFQPLGPIVRTDSNIVDEYKLPGCQRVHSTLVAIVRIRFIHKKKVILYKHFIFYLGSYQLINWNVDHGLLKRHHCWLKANLTNVHGHSLESVESGTVYRISFPPLILALINEILKYEISRSLVPIQSIRPWHTRMHSQTGVS